jgi:G3E family GTPase
MEGAGNNTALAPHIAQYLESHFDALAKRFGADADFLVATQTHLCDKTRRADLEAFINERAAKNPQLRLKFGDTFEKAALCEAGLQIQVPRLKAYLAAP